MPLYFFCRPGHLDPSRPSRLSRSSLCYADTSCFFFCILSRAHTRQTSSRCKHLSLIYGSLRWSRFSPDLGSIRSTPCNTHRTPRGGRLRCNTPNPNTVYSIPYPWSISAMMISRGTKAVRLNPLLPRRSRLPPVEAQHQQPQTTTHGQT